MIDREDEDHDLLVEIARLYHYEPERPGKTADLTALVARADAEDLVNAAVFGRLCLALRANFDRDLATCASSFAWCERAWTERGDELLEITVEMLLVMYGVLLHNVRTEPRIPFAQVDRFVAAMIDRYRQYGRSLRSPFMQAYLTALLRDDLPAVEQYFRWWQAEREEESALPGEAIAMVWLTMSHQWDAVVAQYHQGLSTMEERPWVGEALHAGVLAAFVALGRLDEARAAHVAGLAAIDAKNPDLDAVGAHLDYLAAIDDLDAGLALLGEHLPSLAAVRPAGLRVGFCQSAVVLLHRLRATDNGSTRLAGARTVDELHDELRAESIEYARTIDQVNATDIGVRRLARVWSEHGVPAP